MMKFDRFRFVALVFFGMFLCLGPLKAQQTYTTSGNGAWDSSNTWQGGFKPGILIETNDIVKISSGDTVTLDQNLTIQGSDSSLIVNGTLKGSGIVAISQGAITGSIAGCLNIDHLNLTTSDALSLGGLIKVQALTIQASNELVTKVTVQDTVYLKDQLKTVPGGNLVLADGASFLINGGSFGADGGPGPGPNPGEQSFTTLGAYHVLYKGASTASGVLLEKANPTDVVVNLNTNDHQVDLENDVTVKGELSVEKGRMDLNGYQLEIQGDLVTGSDGKLAGNPNSVLYINTTDGLTSPLAFAQGHNSLKRLLLNTGAGNIAELDSDLHIAQALKLDQGRLFLGTDDLSFEGAAKVNGQDTSSYLVTNGTGTVNKVVPSNDSATYAVGTSLSYSPVTVTNNSNDSVSYNVQVKNGVSNQGTSGYDLADAEPVVNRTWLVDKENPGSVSTDLKVEWTADIEVNNFDRNNCYLSHFKGGNWDSVTSISASKTTQGTFAIERAKIQYLSPFGVFDESINTGQEEHSSLSAGQKLYPNPVRDQLKIQANFTQQIDKVQIYTTSGQLLKTCNITSNGTSVINVGDLESGTYIFRTLGSEATTLGRFIKQ